LYGCPLEKNSAFFLKTPVFNGGRRKETRDKSPTQNKEKRSIPGNFSCTRLENWTCGSPHSGPDGSGENGGGVEFRSLRGIFDKKKGGLGKKPRAIGERSWGGNRPAPKKKHCSFLEKRQTMSYRSRRKPTPSCVAKKLKRLTRMHPVVRKGKKGSHRGREKSYVLGTNRHR